MCAGHKQAEALFFEGTRRMASDDCAGAGACFNKALSLQPDFPEVLANLGLLHERKGSIPEAETCYRRAIALAPGSAQVYLNLGVMLMNGKRFAEAEVVYRQALRLTPQAPAVWSNYGVLLACSKREEEAEQCYRMALGLDSRYAKASFNMAYVLLRQGRFEEGWHCLEAREWRGYERLAAHFNCPRWRGQALTGKSLVIGFEAGHGDMIQFCRYATLLKAMGAARIAVVCHPGLKLLFGSLSGVDEVFSFDDDVPVSGWDFWSPPMSLPYYCRTRIDNIPAEIPFLAADPSRRARWNSLLPASGIRIGLVWKGNPDFENDPDRSLPSLDVLLPLWSVPGVSFVSLQKGPGEDEAQHTSADFPLLALGHALDDFADTAAVISGLDLVISVDTAVAHLTGALGKPCWVLLPDYRTDWRWLSGRSDSPWYPQGMRLFRQLSGGDWAPVIATVLEVLKNWKKAPGAPDRSYRG